MAELIQLDVLPSLPISPVSTGGPRVVNRRIPEWLTIKLPKRQGIEEVEGLIRGAVRIEEADLADL